MNIVLTFFLSLLMSGGYHFDKTVHDFGTVSQSDGELECSFILNNDSQTESLSILAVVSSCGCTGVTWTREAIAPGKRGIVTAKYSNDEGPYPFDKTLRVYLSSEEKPVVLHIKGNVVKKIKK